MKQPIIIAVILLSLVFISSYKWQDKTEPEQVNLSVTNKPPHPFKPDQFVYGTSYEYKSNKPQQIAHVVCRIFEDSRGNLWFGTNNLGVCRYDGDTLVYFSTHEGLSGGQVTGILEDQRGNIWFSTNGGVSMYDGNLFTNFTEKDGLSSNTVWSLYEDSRGTIWASTTKGLYRYTPGEGAKFTAFTLPQTDVSNSELQFFTRLVPSNDEEPRLSTKMVLSIMEDTSGNLWFGTDGLGVYKFNPSAEKTGAKQFTHFSMADGLCDNSIVCIIEDKGGNIWFSSRFGGLSRYKPSATTAAGESFTNFTVANGAIGNNEVWTMLEDRAGTIWFSSEGYGMYRFKDNLLSHYGKVEGLPIQAVQSIFEDKQGRLWVGGANAVYFFDGKKFVEFTRNGPMQGC